MLSVYPSFHSVLVLASNPVESVARLQGLGYMVRRRQVRFMGERDDKSGGVECVVQTDVRCGSEQLIFVGHVLF